MDDSTVPTFTEFINALSKQVGKKLTLTGAVLPDGKVVEYGGENVRTEGHASGQDDQGVSGSGCGPDVVKDA